jgi:molybdopterin-guanine dinucleotide biosynthesis protein B
LILVEGFKAERFPKIELHRSALKHPLLYPNDPDIIAIASDYALETPDYLVQLDINQPERIAAFILNDFMKDHD